jgi:JAB1/Mov34/MPN/PAD-1 ubiquitin protease
MSSTPAQSATTAADPTLDEPGRTFESVVVHPLVLLSAVDHHYRIQKDVGKKRVVGILLGETYKGRIDVTNSFAVPFEEDAKDPNIYFLDHDYLENLFFMFKKVSARERIVGFYSTSPKIRPAGEFELFAVTAGLSGPFSFLHSYLPSFHCRPRSRCSDALAPLWHSPPRFGPC